MLVYKITNKINGKNYIGITEKTLDERYAQHLAKCRQGDTRHLYQSMRKYGVDSFEISIIENNIQSLDELKQKEKEYVIKYNAYSLGYNMTEGGDTNPMDSAEVVEKHNVTMRSYKVRTKISKTMKEKNSKGELFSKEHRKHLSESQKDCSYLYNPNTNKITRVKNSQLDDYINAGWVKYIKRPYSQLCGEEMMTPLVIKTNMFSTRGVPCYCILDTGDRFDFPNIREAAIWWFNNYHPFGDHYAECTLQRKIKASMAGKDIIFEIQKPKQEKIKITNIKWYKKEVMS